MISDTKNFVIVTPAYNEQHYLERTIDSVLAQHVWPLAWVIVDDGSADKTPEIIQKYAAQNAWIRHHRRQRNAEHGYYGSNVYAIMEGVELLKGIPYDFLAILDADITLPPEYYETLLKRFEQDPQLGVASGVYQDWMGTYYRKTVLDRRSTPKALQVFRRGCFERIGGYVPLRNGGEDTCSCIMARMYGWKTWSFPDLMASHNKPAGTLQSNSLLKARFQQGMRDYFLATHPLFMIVKSLRRCFVEPPYLIGGFARLAGYLSGYLKRLPRQISPEVIAFVRKEQIGRIFRFNKASN